MSVLVVDASVAGNWFLPGRGETLVDHAFRLFDQYAAGEIRFLVPDLFWAELGNLFWKAVRQERWTRPSAEAALPALQERKLPRFPLRFCSAWHSGLRSLLIAQSTTACTSRWRCTRNHNWSLPMSVWRMLSQLNCQ